MKRLDMKVKPREGELKGRGRAVRRQGFVPAIIYGAGQPNVAVAVDEKEFRTALRAGGAQAIIDVKVEGQSEATLAIIKEIQYDALGDEIQHVDFYRITEGEPIQVTVPVTATGRSEGEKEGGIVEHLTREVRVECLPRDIPENVPFDISALTLGESMHLSDLTPPPGVTFLDSLETALVVVKAPRMVRADVLAEEEAALAAEAAAAEAAEGEEAPEGEREEKTPPSEEGSA
ncbi:MAG TPA: 50S ribosomal protein L25 [bacterium]|nr:50S ribosomal protein L25 [bacterium]